jgi:biotin carboxyl carrier protein
MNTYKYKVNGVDYVVEIADVEGRIAKVNVNGIPFELEMQKPINVAKHPSLAPHRLQSAQQVAQPAAPAAAAPAAAPAAVQQPAAPAGAGNPQKAPLPGTVIDVKVQVGQQVNAGDVVVVLEAMKMQNNIEAEYSGKVTSILVKPGETVMEGAVLLTIG